MTQRERERTRERERESERESLHIAVVFSGTIYTSYVNKFAPSSIELVLPWWSSPSCDHRESKVTKNGNGSDSTMLQDVCILILHTHVPNDISG